MCSYDEFSRRYFPAFYYAMGKSNDDVFFAKDFGEYFVDACREADKVLSISEIFQKWSESR